MPATFAGDSAEGASAFAALEAIRAGKWDRYLLRLRSAIESRRQTAEYEQHIVAGTPNQRLGYWSPR